MKALSFRLVFVVAAAAAAFCSDGSFSGGTASAAERPNILIIVADDMGFSDAQCYGGDVSTPNLNQLAAEGLRYTQFYNTSRCWTTRVSLLTGLYHHLAESIHMGRRHDLATRLLPELLRPLGYRCYHSGKWHVRGTKPTRRGFDRSFLIADHNRFFYPKRLFEDDQPLPPVPPGSGYYLTTDIAEHAIRYLREHAAHHADRPFFLYLAFTSPHFPLQAPQQDIDVYRNRYVDGWDVVRQRRYQRQKEMGLVNCPLSPRDPKTIPPWNFPEEELQRQIGPGEVGYAVAWDSLTDEQKRFQSIKMAIHAAMIHRMDREIGRVIQQIRSMGQWDNTLCLFLSDNGASAEQIIRGDGHDPTAPPGSGKTFLCLGPGWSTAANTPFRLHKSWVHEGGIATPLIVRYPARIRDHGRLRHAVGHVIDIVPTIAELTGATWPERVDGKPVVRPHGVSLLRTFERDEPVQREFLFWEHIGNRALRVGNWKLVAKKDGPWELYDMSRAVAKHTTWPTDSPNGCRPWPQSGSRSTSSSLRPNTPAESERRPARPDGAPKLGSPLPGRAAGNRAAGDGWPGRAAASRSQRAEGVREFIRVFPANRGFWSDRTRLSELASRHEPSAATTKRGPPIPGHPQRARSPTTALFPSGGFRRCSAFARMVALSLGAVDRAPFGRLNGRPVKALAGSRSFRLSR